MSRNEAPRRPKSFKEWLANTPTNYLICRDMGHAWPNDGWSGHHIAARRGGGFMLSMICIRCGLPRLRYIGPSGEVHGAYNRFDYTAVPGYLYSEDGFVLGRERRMELRLELMRRAREESAPTNVSFIQPKGA